MSMFDMLDRNHDGTISREEFNQAFGMCGGSARMSSPSAVVTSRAGPPASVRGTAVVQSPFPRGAVTTSFSAAPTGILPTPPTQMVAPATTMALPAPAMVNVAPTVTMASPPVATIAATQPMREIMFSPPPVTTTAPAVAPVAVQPQFTEASYSVSVPPVTLTAAPAQMRLPVTETAYAAPPAIQSSYVAPQVQTVTETVYSAPRAIESAHVATPVYAPPPPKEVRGERVVGERPISREELANSGNLVEAPAVRAPPREREIVSQREAYTSVRQIASYDPAPVMAPATTTAVSTYQVGPPMMASPPVTTYGGPPMMASPPVTSCAMAPSLTTYAVPSATSYTPAPSIATYAAAAPVAAYAASPGTYSATAGSYTTAIPVQKQASLFDQLDTNHDGVITRDEMARAVNPSPVGREISSGYGIAARGMPLSNTAYVAGRAAAVTSGTSYARGGTLSSSPVAVV